MKLAWLAGLLDGEGSVGIGLQEGSRSAQVAVQLSMTCEKTVEAAWWVMKQVVGVTVRMYGYSEKNPEKHLPAWRLAIGRIADCHRLAVAMEPLAITKKPQWALMREFTAIRLAQSSLDPKGRIIRGRRPNGGPFAARVYSPREIAIVQELRVLNVRGVAAVKRNAAWLARTQKQLSQA